MGENFFESPVLAKRAMKDNLFTEVYLSTAVTTPIQLKGWVTQPNPYERHGKRWHLYLSRVESCGDWPRATGRTSPRAGPPDERTGACTGDECPSLTASPTSSKRGSSTPSTRG